MNKRISDEELNVMKLLHPMKGEKYDVTVSNVDLLDLCNDLQDAREIIKTIETYGAMLKKKKPSLTEHLQKLANNHKMCFALNQLQTLVMYDRGALFIVNAEEFFGFNKDNFYCDIEVNDVIYPEADNE